MAGEFSFCSRWVKNMYLLCTTISIVNIVRPIPNSKASTIVSTVQDICNMLDKKYWKPKFEALNTIKEFCSTNQSTINLSIQKNVESMQMKVQFKPVKYFISGLCSNDSNFPMQLRCQLIPQAKDSFEMLLIAQDGPSKSAYKIVHGKHNLNAQPLAIAGCKTIVHEHPLFCTSQGPRGTDAWYTRPAKDHYQCHQRYIMETNMYWICKGVTFVPKTFYHTQALTMGLYCSDSWRTLYWYYQTQQRGSKRAIKASPSIRTIKEDIQKHNLCCNHEGYHPYHTQ